jgi:hypothetical protein
MPIYGAARRGDSFQPGPFLVVETLVLVRGFAD